MTSINELTTPYQRPATIPAPSNSACILMALLAAPTRLTRSKSCTKKGTGRSHQQGSTLAQKEARHERKGSAGRFGRGIRNYWALCREGDSTVASLI